MTTELTPAQREVLDFARAFTRDEVAWEAAGGDPFKRLSKPTAVITLERPDFPQHATHQDALAPAAKR